MDRSGRSSCRTFIQELFRDSDFLLRHSALVTFASLTGGGMNFLSQAFLGRMLVAEEFGVLSAMLGLLTIMNVPSAAIQTCIVRFSSVFSAQGRPEMVRWLFSQSCRKLLGYGCLILVPALLARGVIAARMRLDSDVPVIITALIFVGMLLVPVVLGIFQGTQRFMRFTVVGVSLSMLRLAMGVFLVWLGLGALGALIGYFLAVVLALVVSTVLVRNTFPDAGATPQPKPEGGLEGVAAFFWPVFITTGVMAVMMNFDIVVVKVVCEAETAGIYARVAASSKIFSWITGPIVTAMFPKIVQRREKNTEVFSLFAKALVVSLGIVMFVTVLSSLFPGIPVGLLFGAGHEDLYASVRLSVWMFAPFPILYMMFNFLMARSSFRFVPAAVVLCASFVVALVIRNKTYFDVLTTVGLFSFASVCVSCYYVFLELKQGEEERSI